jgi:hypothetical protein
MRDTRDLVASWGQWMARVSEHLRRERTDERRAAALAGQLHALVPEARGIACRLGGRTALQGQLPQTSFPIPPDSGVQRSNSPEGVTLLAGFPDGLADRGLLVLGLPAGYPEQAVAVLEALLPLAAASLGQALQLETARREQEEAADLVTVGEAAIGMVHAIVNHLNSMMLQSMAVQIRLTDPLRSDLEVIRREGRQAAARLQQLQSIREQPLETSGYTDLEHTLRAALQQIPEAERPTPATSEAKLPLVKIPRWTAQRLLRMLVNIIRTCHAGHRPAPIRVECRDEGISLSAELDGPTLRGESGTPGEPGRLIDLEGVSGGISELERTAAHYLARRLEGRLEVRNRPGGVVFTLTWPTTMLVGQPTPAASSGQ